MENAGHGETGLDAALGRAAVVELHPAGRVPEFGGDGAEVARDPAAFGVGEEVEAGAGRGAAVVNGLDELRQAAGAILLGEAAEFGVHRVAELAAEKDVGVASRCSRWRPWPPSRTTPKTPAKGGKPPCGTAG